MGYQQLCKLRHKASIATKTQHIALTPTFETENRFSIIRSRSNTVIRHRACDRSATSRVARRNRSFAESGRRHVLITEAPECTGNDPIEDSGQQRAEDSLPPAECAVAPADQVHDESDEGNEYRHDRRLFQALPVVEQLLDRILHRCPTLLFVKYFAKHLVVSGNSSADGIQR